MEQKSNVQYRAEKEYKNSREKFSLLLREIISNSIHAVLIRQSKRNPPALRRFFDSISKISGNSAKSQRAFLRAGLPRFRALLEEALPLHIRGSFPRHKCQSFPASDIRRLPATVAQKRFPFARRVPCGNQNRQVLREHATTRLFLRRAFESKRSAPGFQVHFPQSFPSKVPFHEELLAQASQASFPLSSSTSENCGSGPRRLRYSAFLGACRRGLLLKYRRRNRVPKRAFAKHGKAKKPSPILPRGLRQTQAGAPLFLQANSEAELLQQSVRIRRVQTGKFPVPLQNEMRNPSSYKFTFLQNTDKRNRASIHRNCRESHF